MADSENIAADLKAEDSKSGGVSTQPANDNGWAKDDIWSTSGQDPWSTVDTPGADPDTTSTTAESQTKPAQGHQSQGAKKKRPNQPRKQSNKAPKDQDRPASKEKPTGKEKSAEKGVKSRATGAKANATNSNDGESEGRDKDNAEGGDAVNRDGEQGKDLQESTDVKEKEKKKPYINPERFKTGGAQVDKLSPEELAQRMEAIRLKNEQIKQRRAAVEADEQAFNALQQAEEKKRHAARKAQDQINHTRDEIARRKMEKMKDREWDNQKKGGRPGPGRGQSAGAVSSEQPSPPESQDATSAPAA